MPHLDFLHAHLILCIHAINTSSTSPEALPASTPVSVSPPPPPTDKLPNLDIIATVTLPRQTSAEMLQHKLQELVRHLSAGVEPVNWLPHLHLPLPRLRPLPVSATHAPGDTHANMSRLKQISAGKYDSQPAIVPTEGL